MTAEAAAETRCWPDWRALRAVTFDAGGTLLDPHPSVGEVYAEVAGVYGVTASAAELEARFRTAFRERAARPRLRVDEASERGFWAEIVAEVFAPWGGARPAGLFDALWHTFAEARRWRPRPGAAEVLQTLRARGYAVAILSNWDARLHAVVRELGWTPLLQAVLVSAELGVEKPDPRAFAIAAERLGASATAALHVGDSAALDAAGALAAGWSAALVGGATHPGAFAVSELTGLLAHLPGPPGGATQVMLS
jgi:putative hydrolase of the HAD superfamily